MPRRRSARTGTGQPAARKRPALRPRRGGRAGSPSTPELRPRRPPLSRSSLSQPTSRTGQGQRQGRHPGQGQGQGRHADRGQAGLPGVTPIAGSSETRAPSRARSAPTETTWTAAERLEPSAKYTLTMVGRNADKKSDTETASFTTHAAQPRPADVRRRSTRQGRARSASGMPVILTFDVPVKDKAEFQKNLHVQSTPDPGRAPGAGSPAPRSASGRKT